MANRSDSNDLRSIAKCIAAVGLIVLGFLPVHASAQASPSSPGALDARPVPANETRDAVNQVPSAVTLPAPPLTFVDSAGESVEVSPETWRALARHELQVTDRTGNHVRYEGVLLADLLRRMGMPFGEELKGAYADLVVRIEARDKYGVAFSLIELDPATPGKTVLIAQFRDGHPLDDREGPIRLVVPDETRQVRWIRMMRLIHVFHSTAPPSSRARPLE